MLIVKGKDYFDGKKHISRKCHTSDLSMSPLLHFLHLQTGVWCRCLVSGAGVWCLVPVSGVWCQCLVSGAAGVNTSPFPLCQPSLTLL